MKEIITAIDTALDEAKSAVFSKLSMNVKEFYLREVKGIDLR